MRPITPTILLAVILTLGFTTGAAQQSGTKKAPLLTSEDLRAPSDSSLSSASASKSITRDSAKWQRYAPSELGLSIELPGKPLLLGLTFPDAGQQLSPAKAYTYQDEQITVFVLRFTSKKLPVSSNDLRNFGAGFLDASARKPGISDVKNQTRPGDDSTVLLLSTYAEGSVYFETRGFVHTNGNELWLIVTKFAQTDEPAKALSLRVMKSVNFD
jgi:hypothetical protein